LSTEIASFKNKALSSLLSFVLAISLVLVGSTNLVSIEFASTAYAAQAQATPLTVDEVALVEAIDPSYIFSHVQYISDEIGVRVAGGPAEKHAADYLADTLEDLGYDPFHYATDTDGTPDYLQTVYGTSGASDTVDSGIVNIIGGSITIGGHEYPANAPNYSATSVYKGYESSEVTGETIYFPTVAEAIAADPSTIEGKIVLTHRETATYAPDVRVLEEKGAKAVVYFYNKYTVNSNGRVSSESRYGAVTSGDAINIPVILTSYFDGQAIIADLTHSGSVHSDTATVTNARNTTTQNVIAIKPAAEPSDQYVLIGGHYDSVFGSPGANDNLSGAATVLGIAQALEDVPTTYNVVFAFWGSEEAGLRGSRYFYANTLAPDDFYKNFIAYYNLDMAATTQQTNSYLTIHTPYRTAADETGKRTPIGSTAADIVIEQAAKYWEYSAGEWGDLWSEGVIVEYYGNCSDHASIAGANATPALAAGEGIPVAYTFWRDAGAENLNNSGQGTGEVTEYNYHVVGDRYDWPGDSFTVAGDDHPYAGNFSKERAQILGSIYALAVYESAGALPTTTPLPTATLSFTGATSVVDGFEASYTVSLGAIENLANLAVIVDASDNLEFTGAESLIEGVSVIDSIVNDDNTVTVVLGTFEQPGLKLDETTPILELKFKASGVGTASVTLTSADAAIYVYEGDEFNTSDIETVLPADGTETAETEITEYVDPYDFNRDGQLSLADLSYAQAYYRTSAIIGGDAWAVVLDRGIDVNFSNEVDVADFILIVNRIYPHG
jgi:aminopeptidase YwaD